MEKKTAIIGHSPLSGMLERLQAAMQQMVIGDIREMVCNAVCAAEGADYSCYIVDIYPDAVVYESTDPDGVEKYFRRSYAITDGNVTLGEAAQVEKQVSYIPLQAASRIVSAVGQPGDEEYGYKWRVQVVEYGPGKDGRINWPREPLVAAINLYDGARVFALTDSQHQAAGKPFGKSVREIVGWLKNPQDTGTGIEADFFILKAAQWLRDALVDSHERGNPTLLGLSHDVTARAVTKMVEGKRMKEPVEITGVEVDVVYDPTNNGKFLRMAAAKEAGREEDEMFQRLLAAIKGKRPDLHQRITEGITAGSMSEEQAVQMVAAATVKEAGGDENNAQMVAAMVSGMKEMFGGESGELKEMKLMASGMTLDRELQAAKLPAKAEENIRNQFKDQVFETAALQAAIKTTKEMIDDLTSSGQVMGMGDTRVVLETTDKLQAACDKMFGLTVEGTANDVAAFASLRAAYVQMTGDTEIRGYIDDPAKLRRLQAAGFDSGTFQFVLGNTLYRRMISDYREIPDYGVSLLVGNNIRNARDFRSIQSVRIAYFADLPDVDPENDQDYADLGNLGDEKVDYTLKQKGGIITISRKMIINDDIRAVDTIRRRLPRAARRTLAKRIWNLLINNATYLGDNKACFHADHNNLDTAAFGQTALTAMKTRLFRQTEPGSGETLALNMKTLVIPQDLWGTATSLNQTQNFLVDGAQSGNPFYHFFGANNENIFVCPFMTDPNDYYGLGDPSEAEIVELAFLNGQQEPEMFVADNPNFGQFFVGDRIQYKVRHEYEGQLTDFRGVQKNIVP